MFFYTTYSDRKLGHNFDVFLIVGIIVSSTTAAGVSASEVAGVIVGFIKSNPDEEGAVIVDEGGFVAI